MLSTCEFAMFLPVLSIVDHLSHLDRVLKSFVVVLSDFKSTEINLLKHKRFINFLQICKTNTCVIVYPFLSACHNDINRDFMHFITCMSFEKRV